MSERAESSHDLAVATAASADERGEPGTELRFMNLFLGPDQAAALPFRVTFPYGDPFERDKELEQRGDKYSPIPTADVHIEIDRAATKLIPAVAWLSSILSFITRSTAYADALVDRGGLAGGWEEHLHTNIGPPRFGRRKGSPMFRMPSDLRSFVEAAWSQLDNQDFEKNGVPDAMEWHNFARGGHEIHYLDIQLVHQWIALEVLAAQWAKKNGLDKLLTNRHVDEARSCLKELADRHELEEADRTALLDKAAELKRRPMKVVVLEYLGSLFAPYPKQPTDSKLEILLTKTIKWRNITVHDGSLAMHDWKRDEDGATGIQQVRRGIMQLEGLTARALLAEIGSPLELLTEIPWTDWRQPA